MGLQLTTNEILYAATMAFLLTWVIIRIKKNLKIVIGNSTAISYSQEDVAKIIKKCYSMFPRDIISFRGETFKRGMDIRVKTMEDKIIEGRFMGLNNNNMMCILTKQHIVAHDLAKIDEIILLLAKQDASGFF